MNKITVLWPLPPWKGISQYVKWFVEAMGKQTWVQVLDFSAMYPKALYPGWNPKQEWVEIPQYPWVSSQQLLTRRNPLSWIKAWFFIEWEVLHMQYWIRFLSPIYIVVWIIARYIKKIPVILTIHNVRPHEIAKRKMFLDKIVYCVATKFIVHSENNKQQLQELIGKEKEIKVFPHGIIIPEVPKIEKLVARDLLVIAQEKKVILFFGVIRPYKWLHVALEALASLVKDDSDYHLLIAGKCRSDWKQYQEVITNLGLWSHITRVDGFLDDIQLSQVFSASDLMILPYTHFDAQSGVVALWLWYWLPMVVSRLWGLIAIIDDEKYICEVNDVLSLTNCITEINVDDANELILTKQTQYSRKYIATKLLDWYPNE